MRLSATSCFDWRLYVIIDAAAAGRRDLCWIAAEAIRGGADVLQLRHKTASAARLIDEARALLTVTRRHRIPLIINDRADVAAAVGAEGVHVGQEDIPVAAARRLLGDRAVIGKSTHSLAQALAASKEPVNYIAVGPIFSTPTKPDARHVGPSLIRRVTTRVSIPVVAIGGIDRATLEPVLRAGARCVAVVRAVCSAPRPAAAARCLKQHVQAAASQSHRRSV